MIGTAVCSVCRKTVLVNVRKRPFGRKWKRRMFAQAEDGDQPGEVVVPHYVVSLCQRYDNIYTLAEHKKGLLKKCEASGRIIKEEYGGVTSRYLATLIPRKRGRR